MRTRPLIAFVALTIGSLGAQSATPEAARWAAGPILLGGPGLLVGASVSFVALRSGRGQIAVEASGLTNVLRPVNYACLNSWNCRNDPPAAQARALQSLGINGHQDIGARFYASAYVGALTGHWQYPIAESGETYAVGLGLGRKSKNGRHSLEARWQQFGTLGAPTSGLRFAWQRRW